MSVMVKNKVKKELNIHRHSEGNVMTEESTAMYSDVMDPSVGYASLKDDRRGGVLLEMMLFCRWSPSRCHP